MSETMGWVRKEKTGLGLVVVGVLVWLVGLEVWQPGFFVADDNGAYFLGAFVHNWRAVVEQGTIPFLNYYQELGTRFLGQGQPAVFYPLMWVGLLVSKLLTGDVLHGVMVIAIEHLLISAVGMYVWMRQRGVRWWLVVMGVWWWVSMPYVMTFTSAWVFMSYLMAYLPWGWWLFERVVVKGKSGWRWLVLARVLLGLAGYPQWMLLVFGLELVWLAGGWLSIKFGAKNSGQNRQTEKQINRGTGRHGNRETIRLAGWWLGSWLWAVVLTAVVWVPIGVSKLMSDFRSETLVFEEFNDPYVQWWPFVKAQLGLFEPEQVFYASGFLYFVGVLGLGVWLGLAIGYRKVRGYFGLAVLGWLMSSWWGNFLVWVPGFNMFRTGVKYLVVFVFMVVVGTVLGLEEWVGKVSARKKVAGWLLVVFLGMNVVVFLGRYDEEKVFSPKHLSWPWDYKYEDWIRERVGDYRVVSYRGDVGNRQGIYQRLVYNYATVVGVYHLGGFQLLAPMESVEMNGRFPTALATYYGKLAEEDRERMRGLGLKYWLVPTTEVRLKDLEEMGLVEVDRYEGTALFEDPEAGPVVKVDRGDVEVAWGINSVELVSLDKQEKKVVISVAPLPWYYVWFDGNLEGGVSRTREGLVVRVPEGVERVVVRYVDWSFWVGLLVSGCGVVGWLLVRARWDQCVRE